MKPDFFSWVDGRGVNFIDLFLFCLYNYLALEYAKRKDVINCRILVLGQDNLATIIIIFFTSNLLMPEFELFIILHLRMPLLGVHYLAL